jgi:polyhydroxyalkanoate synthesis regulator phasin
MKNKNTKKSVPVGSSTMKAMNAYVENLTAAAKTKTKPTPAPVKRSMSIVKGKKGIGIEPITYDALTRKSDKKAKQIHTRDEITERIEDLRKQVADLYAKGKFTTNALVAVLTCIDNLTFFKCCGEFDRAYELSFDLETRLNNA